MFLKINVNFTVRLTSRARLMRLGENGRGFVRLDVVIGPSEVPATSRVT